MKACNSVGRAFRMRVASKFRFAKFRLLKLPRENPAGFLDIRSGERRVRRPLPLQQ
jgi:hypothetical protein